MSYPVAVQIDYVQRRSRLSTFFRILLLIPLEIVGFVWLVGAYGAVLVAWFVLLFTGRWPIGLYGYTASVLEWIGRFNAYMHLATDPFPPWGLHGDGYPAHVTVGPPLESYSRLKVLLRIFYALPVVVLCYLIALMLSVVTFASWLVIVFTGNQPSGLQNVLTFGVTYYTRATALLLLVTQTYPPLEG